MYKFNLILFIHDILPYPPQKKKYINQLVIGDFKKYDKMFFYNNLINIKNNSGPMRDRSLANIADDNFYLNFLRLSFLSFNNYII